MYPRHRPVVEPTGTSATGDRRLRRRSLGFALRAGGPAQVSERDPCYEARVSFDLAVWFESAPITNEDATKKYHQLAEGDVTGATEHPSIERFVRELSARYPNLDDLPEDELDDSPWSCGFDRSDAHVLTCMRWSVSKDVIDLIAALAEKHGLVLYDPQGSAVHLPSALVDRSQ